MHTTCYTRPYFTYRGYLGDIWSYAQLKPSQEHVGEGSTIQQDPTFVSHNLLSIYWVGRTYNTILINLFFQPNGWMLVQPSVELSVLLVVWACLPYSNVVCAWVDRHYYKYIIFISCWALALRPLGFLKPTWFDEQIAGRPLDWMMDNRWILRTYT